MPILWCSAGLRRSRDVEPCAMRAASDASEELETCEGSHHPHRTSLRRPYRPSRTAPASKVCDAPPEDAGAGWRLLGIGV